MATNKTSSAGGKGNGPRLPTKEEKQKVITALNTILKDNQHIKLQVEEVKNTLENLDYLEI
jgi:hypothetical protein